MKIAIGGIKFSGELAHFRYQPTSGGPSLAALLAGLAQARVNVPFLSVAGTAGDEAVFCVAEGDFQAVENVLHRLSSATENDQWQSDDCQPPGLMVRRRVGMLTIFPHRRSFAMLGRVLATLHTADIAIYSFCTSISALAINIDYQLLVRAVEVLDGLVELPENHAPFHPEFCICQTAPRS